MNEFLKALEQHAKDDTKNFETINKSLLKMDEKLDKVLEIYDGFDFVGRLLVRGGIIATAVTAIVGAGYAIIQSIKYLIR
jgi:hypothetical protein